MQYDFDPANLLHWSFDQCPKEEILRCWSYEHLRDCPSVIDKVLKWREQQRGQPDDALVRPGPDNGNPFERVIPQWPMLPYLAIPQKERRLYLEIRTRQHAALRDWMRTEDLKKEAASFRVSNWSASEAELVKQFKKWLEVERPKEYAIRETRGRPNMARNMAAWLRALGAYRLSRVMSQNQVIGYAEGLGRHLYADQPQLSKVLKRTAIYLEWLDQT